MNVIDKYVYEMTRVMKRAFPYMTNQDLEAAIRYSVNKRYKEQLCKVDFIKSCQLYLSKRTNLYFIWSYV